MSLPPLPPLKDEWTGEEDIYSKEQMHEYGQLCIDEYKHELAQELLGDCENGVRFLSERVLTGFKKDFPGLWEAMQ